MKKIILTVLIFTNTIFANNISKSLNSIFENIILKNTKQTSIDLNNIKIHIQNHELQLAKKEFVNLVNSWKSVQSFYILGDLDDNYLDTPRYIDIFHEGNEDIKVQIDLILSNNEDLNIAHFKNSHKTINALEYVLFTKNIKTKRVNNVLIRIINNLETFFVEINDGYIKNKNKFVKNEINSNAIMLNSLIENSYKLKEWRVGDVAGLSRKYKDKKDNKRAEYYISKNSTLAIKAIINTHLQVLNKQSYLNFGDMIRSYGANTELDDSIHYLKQALINVKNIKNEDFSNSTKLYYNLKKLHLTYYISLINKLKITAKILDADGD